MSAHAPQVGEPEVWQWLSAVPDPEIPVISVVDLGIVRDVRWDESLSPRQLVVTITPTYSGCPATEVIAQSIRDALAQHGIADARLETRISPAWTTDWLTAEAREKLREYGIAPPEEQVVDISRIGGARPTPPRIACPRCGSDSVECISQFGSTPCKALYRCLSCREPFDYFKCH